MANLTPVTGRILDENGNVINLVGILGDGVVPVNDDVYNIGLYEPSSGRVIGENGRVYSLVELLRNSRGVQDLRVLLAEKADFEANALWRNITGNPCGFFPVPGSPLHYTIKTTATQAGTGDPSLTNIRSIMPALTAGQAARVKHMGKNLLDFSGAATLASCTRINIDNGVRLTTTTTGNASATWRLPLSLLGKTVSIQATLRTVSGVSVGHQIWLNFGAGTNTTVQNVMSRTPVNGYLSGTATIPSSLPNGAEWLAFRVYANMGTGEVGAVVEYSDIQLELGSTVSTLEPYTNVEYIHIAQRAMCGSSGAEDGFRSDGTETHRDNLLEFNVTEGWQLHSINEVGIGNFLYVVPESDAWNDNASIKTSSTCSHFVYTDTLIANATTRGFMLSSTRNLFIRLQPGDLPDMSLAAFKAWLMNQHTNNTPLQVRYRRATPLVLSGIPANAISLPQSIRTSPRQNVLMVDGGTLTVEYAKSLNRESDELRAAITTLGGTI